MAKGNFKYHIHNVTATPVIVVMDHDREVHEIGPAATVIFEDANKFDNPTFRVFAKGQNGERGNLLFTDTFFTGINPFSWSRGLVWTGSKLEDAD